MGNVTLEVNRQRYGGWESVSIEKSIENLSGGFNLSLTERWPGQEVIRAIGIDDRCIVRIDNDVVITGWIDDLNPNLDSTAHDIEVSGRDAAGDLIDCSAIHKPSQWSGQTIAGIIQELISPFKVGLKINADIGEPFKKFALEQGETVHEAIARMCKLRALLAISDGKGNIVLTTSDKAKKASVSLIEGENIKGINQKLSSKERFSEIHVKSQTQGSDTTPAAVTTGWKGNAKDPAIKRYRPLLIVAEGQLDAKQCQQRAAWEVSNRRGKAEQISLTVAGWRQSDKANAPLWDINMIVFVDSPTLKVKERLLISGVRFTLDNNGGSITVLTLSPPSAFSLIREPEPKR